jgi:hypothetical protein
MITQMGPGRLIRVNNRGDSPPATYIVGEADATKAIEIIRNTIGASVDDNIEALIQDLGRVSEELLKAMSLGPGQFVPVDGVKHVSQQQQQPQPVSKKQT